MKRTVTAGILALVSSIWAIAISAYVELNLTDSWMDFRFLESAGKLGVLLPLLLSLAVMAASVIYLVVSFFRKSGK